MAQNQLDLPPVVPVSPEDGEMPPVEFDLDAEAQKEEE
jgi:hypothetical protein